MAASRLQHEQSKTTTWKPQFILSTASQATGHHSSVTRADAAHCGGGSTGAFTPGGGAPWASFCRLAPTLPYRVPRVLKELMYVNYLEKCMAYRKGYAVLAIFSMFWKERSICGKSLRSLSWLSSPVG